MCGRYTLERIRGLEDRYDAYEGTPAKIDLSYNISPGTINPIIARRNPNKIYLMKWGLVPFWAKDPKIGYKMINARAEDIADKPSFRKPIRSQRCLIPATGFYEWKKMSLEGKIEKFPFYIKVKNQKVFSFAGIYDSWRDAEEHEMLTYAIITTTSNKMMEKIHSRMPVILEQKDENEYLNPAASLSQILKFLTPISPELMESWPVSSRVNSPKNDDFGLLKKISNG